MKEHLVTTLQSDTAITFVDALVLLRKIRAKGQDCVQYQQELLAMLEHPLVTAHAQAIIEQALGGELKKITRQRERAQKTLQAKDKGKTVRMSKGAALGLELKSQHGFYWEAKNPAQIIDIRPLIGSEARAGYESFRCIALRTGSETIAFCQKTDARFSKNQTSRTTASPDFYFELIVEDHA